MSKFSREILKMYFLRGKYPTEEQFSNLIDSVVHQDDKININKVNGLTEAISDKAEKSSLEAHCADKANPHAVTAEQLGLGAVDNTADIDKPISTATQTALGGKYDLADGTALAMAVESHSANTEIHVSPIDKEGWNNHATSKANPHKVTAAQVGLGAVDNTADVNKPISAATQAALDEKETPAGSQAKASNALATAKAYADDLVGRLVDSSPAALDTLQELATALGNDPNFATTIARQIGEKASRSVATINADGLMAFGDKIKIDSIASGAEVNVQSNWAESSAASGAFIKNKPASMPASDVYAWAKAANKPTYTASEVGVITPAYEAYKPSNGWSINLGSNFVLTNGIGWQKNWVFVASTETFTVTLPSTSSHYAPFVSKTFAGGVVEISVIKYATDIYVWSYLQIK